MHFSRGGAALALALVARAAAAQIALPALPRLSLDTYPSAARSAISRAHRDASARSADPAAVGALARVLHAWEQWDAAHETYSRAQALAPRAFDWRYLDAIVLQRLARPTDAAAQLKQALSVEMADATVRTTTAGYLPARVKLAEALLDAGDLDESQRLFDALAREPAAEPAAQLGLGRIAAANGHHEIAVAHLLRAIELFPEFGVAHYALALSYRALGKRDEAQRALE